MQDAREWQKKGRKARDDKMVAAMLIQLLDNIFHVPCVYLDIAMIVYEKRSQKGEGKKGLSQKDKAEGDAVVQMWGHLHWASLRMGLD